MSVRQCLSTTGIKNIKFFPLFFNFFYFVHFKLLWRLKKYISKRETNLAKLSTYLSNSCQFKYGEGQVEIQMGQTRRDSTALTVDGDQVMRCGDTWSFVMYRDRKGNTNKWIRHFNTLCTPVREIIYVLSWWSSLGLLFFIFTFCSLQATTCKKLNAGRQVVMHEEVGQVCQWLPSGRQLPVQHSYHTWLDKPNTFSLNENSHLGKKKRFVLVIFHKPSPLLDGIPNYPFGSRHGQGWPHYLWQANSSSANQTACSWLECLCVLQQRTASSRWTPLKRWKYTFFKIKHKYLELLSIMSCPTCLLQ